MVNEQKIVSCRHYDQVTSHDLHPCHKLSQTPLPPLEHVIFHGWLLERIYNVVCFAVGQVEKYN